KMGNLEGASTAQAFIKTLDPGAGFQLTNLITAEMTSIPETWGGYSVAIDIDASLEGQILQFGFLCVATNYEGSGIFYDNVDFDLDVVGIADAGTSPSAAGMTLGQNVPNPFNPQTRIDFTLDQPGMVELAVFDVAGRLIATLHRGELDRGAHQVTWNGRTDHGTAPAGRYFYVLETPAGQVSRSMILLK
ncbi:MAG: FlgD immunoglobulin-like domain containing protein, partial [Candidatus Eiseniibacteriota bacterium]